MIWYLKEIADNSENQVVKAAYGDIFNLSHSDMRALSNITAAEISSLAGNTMSYSQMQGELNNQFNQLKNRTSIATMMTNVYDNVLYSVASDMVNNPVFYSMQKMLDWMNETETDIAIPFVNAMGFGLDLNATVKDIMQMGLGIGQAFSLTKNILSGLSSGGGLNLDSWNAKETTTRGSGLNLTTLSTLGGTSGSIGNYAVSSNSSDAATSSISSATDDSEESKKITNKNSKPPDKTIEDLYKAIVGDSAQSYALAKDPVLAAVYNSNLESLRVKVEGLDLLDGTVPVFDAALKSEFITQILSLRNLIKDHYTLQTNQPSLRDLSNDILTRLSTFDFLVHDSVLPNVYDNSLDTLRVSINEISPSNGSIPVFDAALKEEVNAQLSAINNLLSAHHQSGVQQVKLVEGTVLKMEKETIVSAIREVLFENEDKNLNDLLDRVTNGTLSIESISNPVNVRNANGEKLQVSNLIW